MGSFLAKYSIDAQEYSSGGYRSYRKEEEWSFEANNEEQAKQKALGRIEIIANELIGGAKVSLDSLVEVKKVIL